MTPATHWPRPGEPDPIGPDERRRVPTPGAAGPAEAPGSSTSGSRRAMDDPRQRRIALALGAAVLALVALGVWVVAVPYPVGAHAVSGPGTVIDCDAEVTFGTSPHAQALAKEFEHSCDAPRRERRQTALVIGGLVIVAAAVASTWPSRRLTG